MGIKLTLYNDLKARIIDKVPEFKTVRKWNSQFDNEKKENAWEYPCCFIGFSNMDYQPPKNMTPNVKQLQAAQMGVFIITIYMGFEDLQDETPAFEDYEPLIQKIWYYLQGYKTSSDWNDLWRIAEREDNNHNNVIVWEMDFQVSAADFAACDLTQVDAAPVTLEITPQVFIATPTDNTIRTDGTIP